MTAINRTFSLPDDIAEEAEAAGLLAPEVLARLVQEALDDPRPSIPQAQVFAELRRYRAIRRGM